MVLNRCVRIQLTRQTLKNKETDSGKFRFNLKAANKQVIGTSQSYGSASGRDNGIASVQKNAPGAKVVEV